MLNIEPESPVGAKPPPSGVPVAAEALPSANPPANGEDVAPVVALASEMPPGAAGVAVGAGLPNPRPDPPQTKTKKFKAI